MREAVRDLLREALASLGARRVRAALSALGIALGVAAFVGATSVAQSAGAAIRGRLDEIAVSTITLRLDLVGVPDPASVLRTAEGRLERMPGVTAIGASVDLADVVWAVSTQDDVGVPESRISVLAVSADYRRAIEADRGGPGAPRGDLPHRGVTDPAVVGPRAPVASAVVRDSRDQVMFVGGRPFRVVGADWQRPLDPRADEAVMVSLEAAEARGWLDQGLREATVLVRTAPGQALSLRDAAQRLAWAEHPRRVTATVSADPRALRGAIEGDTLLLTAGLSVLLLLMGLFSIANIMLSSVMERTGEIGLRRALGASRRAVALLLVSEATIIGLTGGAAGSVAGACVGWLVALTQGWPLTWSLDRLLIAPAVGALVGALAGLYPAMRASRVEPASALRGLA